MGCASSKSTPVVDSIVSGANDLKESSNGLLKKGKDAVIEVADEVCGKCHIAKLSAKYVVSPYPHYMV